MKNKLGTILLIAGIIFTITGIWLLGIPLAIWGGIDLYKKRVNKGVSK